MTGSLFGDIIFHSVIFMPCDGYHRVVVFIIYLFLLQVLGISSGYSQNSRQIRSATLVLVCWMLETLAMNSSSLLLLLAKMQLSKYYLFLSLGATAIELRYNN